MADPRDDVYILAALLADIERVLHPLPRGMRGKVRPEPNFPPPLPTPDSPLSGPASGRGGPVMPGGSPTRSFAPPHARAEASVHEATPPRSPRPHGHDTAGSRPDHGPEEASAYFQDAPPSLRVDPATPEQGARERGSREQGSQSSPVTGLVSEPPLLQAAALPEQPPEQPLPNPAGRAPARPELHAPRLPVPELSQAQSRAFAEPLASTTEPIPDRYRAVAPSMPPRLLPPEPAPVERATDRDTLMPDPDPRPTQHAPPEPRVWPVAAAGPEHRPPPLRLAPPGPPDATRVLDNAAASRLSSGHRHRGEPPVVPGPVHPAAAPAGQAAPWAPDSDPLPPGKTSPAGPDVRAPHVANVPEHLVHDAPLRPERRPGSQPHAHDPGPWIAHGLAEPAAIRDESPASIRAPAPEHIRDTSDSGYDPTPLSIEPPEWLDVAAMDWPGEGTRALRRAGRAWPISRHDARRMADKLHVAYLDRALRRWR